jgi:hypothetical protein
MARPRLHPGQQRVEPLTGKVAELDQCVAFEPDPVGYRRFRRLGQPGTISSIGTALQAAGAHSLPHAAEPGLEGPFGPTGTVLAMTWSQGGR